MVTAQLVARLCGLGALLLVTGTAEAQPAASPVRSDTALIAAILRTAVLSFPSERGILGVRVAGPPEISDEGTR